MKLKRMELINELKKVMPGIDSSDSGLQGADAFVFGEDGIHSYNDTVSVSIPVKTGLEGAVKSKEFFAVLQKLKADELAIVQKEEQLIIKAGRSKVTVNLVESAVLDFLQNLHIEDLEWKELPANFMSAMALCKISCSTSPLRGIFVEKDMMVATDEIRINTHTLDAHVETFWMDDPSATELLKIGQDVKHIALSDGWIHFKGASGVVFSCKRKDHSQYPIEGVISWKMENRKKKGDIEGIFPGNFKEVVDRVSVFSEDVNGFNVIHMTFSEKDLLLKSTRQVGSIEESALWDEKLGINEPISTSADAGFLKEAAERSLKFYITQAGAVQSLVFTSDKFTQILATISE